MYLLLIILITGNVLLLISIQQQTKAIEDNQLTNSLALKDYIACLLVINPKDNLHLQEQTCFNKAPEVK